MKEEFKIRKEYCESNKIDYVVIECYNKERYCKTIFSYFEDGFVIELNATFGNGDWSYLPVRVPYSSLEEYFQTMIDLYKNENKTLISALYNSFVTCNN